MAGFDLNEPHVSYQTTFPEGSEVEVSSDEEGFKGAWFRATIVENPVTTKKSKNKDNNINSNNKKVLVEYRNLVTEEGTEQLKEHVELRYVRPLPPEVGRLNFEVGDVVDADYRDGWWTGLVKKAMGNCKYRVFFDNPPDLIEFDLNQMRVHQDWIGGHWVRSKRQPQMTGSPFSPGTDVEVSFDTEDLSDAWVPALVVKENEDNTFLVKYHNARAKNWQYVVDIHHIRPPAPRYADRTYKLHEKVDAFFDFAWRASVITKIHAGKMYTVTFKHIMKSKELSQAEIRPLVEWKDGKWNMRSKEVWDAPNPKLQGKLEHITKNVNDGDVASKPGSLDAADDKNEKQTPRPINSEKNSTEQSKGCNGESASSITTSSVKKMMLSAPTRVGRRGHPLKKFNDEIFTESPLSDTTGQAKKEKHSALATQAKGAKVSMRLRKPVVPFNFESFAEKRARTKRQKDGAVDGQEDGAIDGQMDSAVDGQEGGAIDVQRKDPVKRKGRPKKSQVGSLPTSIVGQAQNVRTSGTTTKNLVEEDGKKEVEVPVRIASDTKGMGDLPGEVPCQILNEELAVIAIEPNPNSNDAAECESTVVSAQLASDPILADLLHSLVLFPNMELKQQEAGGSSSNKRKRGRPKKVVVLGLESSDGVKLQKGAKHVEELIIKACPTNEVALPVQEGAETTDLQEASRRKRADASRTKCITSEIGAISIRPSNTADDDDRPLSTWVGLVQCQPGATETKLLGKTVDQQNVDREQPDSELAAKESLAIAAPNDSLPEEVQRLPFVKSSPVWKVVESMDVFKTMPQRPHFRPLYKCKEECREGLAIGNMVTFSGLVDKITKLRFDDRGNVFSSALESLLDLEKHGFNVTVLRDRVSELLSIKDRQERLRNESKDIEKKMSEFTYEKSRLAEECKDLAKKISELQEKHAVLKSQLESKDVEMAKLQQNADAINGSLVSARLDFEKLAAASLKLA